MTDRELTIMFANSLTSSKRYRVYYNECPGVGVPLHYTIGQYIYLIDADDLYRIEIREGKVEILDTSDCTYEIFELADPVSMERILRKFEVDENIQPKQIEAL